MELRGKEFGQGIAEMAHTIDDIWDLNWKNSKTLGELLAGA